MESFHLPGASSLIEELDRRVMVVLRDGRHLVGILSSIDQYSNIVLEEAYDYLYAGNKVFKEPCNDVIIVRSDNIVLVGQMDDEKEANSSLVEVDRATYEKELSEKMNKDEDYVALTDQEIWDFNDPA
eukprot:CAMPEP_0171503898 /NCGR_PEP_ID=MMETSP0958-20121227/11203_1 /TAXON_ID=87120 /ORGANISM="Aurantiochytrium limacinum, Strain ATCCMYA-1381" /LENGTH=127 /DNA_ID=CAMNT_0012039543 /DNA_START=89 /DNA_END=472 /DNA_ORIENTATION=-